MAVRILLADDHAVFRSGLKALLEKETDLEVIAETGDGYTTLSAVSEHKPDVVVLDISMPGISGSKVAEAILKERPHQAIVVLTMHEDEYYLKEMFRIGVRGFVLKKSTRKEVVQAIRAVHRGEAYVDPSLGGKIISSELAGTPRSDDAGGLARLSQREREVCRLLAYGHTYAEIAEKLSISTRTVETHRSNIMAKLGLETRADLVQFAIDNGLMRLA